MLGWPIFVDRPCVTPNTNVDAHLFLTRDRRIFQWTRTIPSLWGRVDHDITLDEQVLRWVLSVNADLPEAYAATWVTPDEMMRHLIEGGVDKVFERRQLDTP